MKAVMAGMGFCAALVGMQVQAEALLRVKCGDADLNAEVYVNGEFKGECPVDVQVPAGQVSLRVVKPAGEGKERVYEQSMRLADGTAKAVNAELSVLRWTAEGWKKEQARQVAEQDRLQREKEEKERQYQTAVVEMVKAQVSVLAEFKAQGIEPGNGKSFKDCPECPEMVLVPAGSFMMGAENGEEDEKPVHQVNIPYVFAVGKYEVTQAQWKAVMRETPSHFSSFLRNMDDYPVEQVSWHDVQEFMRRLNQKTGKTYRLLSESEWEYATRAGALNYGDENLDALAWFKDNSGGETHAVGVKKANAWGLHDMLGNVQEWVQDHYSSYATTPSGGGAYINANNVQTSSRRVLRGGSWGNEHQYVRTTDRNSEFSDGRYVSNGVRLARTIP